VPNIQVKDPQDIRKLIKGTGRGDKIVNSLKEYADKKNKNLVFVGITSNAQTYWNRFDWLEPEYSNGAENRVYRPTSNKSTGSIMNAVVTL
jgi:hypothetical protein